MENERILLADAAVITGLCERTLQQLSARGEIWGAAKLVRHAATSILTSFDYLLSGNITMKEATERLRLLRRARASLASPSRLNGDAA